MTAPKVYTRAEATQVLRISKSKLDQLVRAGELRVRRVGRRVLIPETAIEEYLNGAPARSAA